MNGDDMKRVKVGNKQVANQFSIHNICKTRDICTLIFKQILLCFDFVFWSVLFLRSMLWLVESKAEFYYVEVYFGIIVGVMAFVTFGHKLFDIYIEPRMKLRVNHDVSKIFLEKISVLQPPRSLPVLLFSNLFEHCLPLHLLYW